MRDPLTIGSWAKSHRKRVSAWMVILSAFLAVSLVWAVAVVAATPEEWAAKFDALPTRGDGMPSCAIDNGRHVFVTGDAEDRSIPGWIGPHSTITVIGVDGAAHVTRPAYPDQNPYQAVRESDPTMLHWLGPCLYYAGKLYVLAPVVMHSPYGQGVRTDLVIFNVPDNGDPVFSKAIPLPRSWSGGLYFARSTGLVYWFGASANATDGWTGRDVYVGRTSIANIAVASSWTYWTGAATGWRHAPTTTCPILRAPRDGGVDLSFTIWWDSRGWNLVSRAGGPLGTINGRAIAVRKSTLDWSKGWTTTELIEIPDTGYLVHNHRWIDPKMLTVSVRNESTVWLLTP